MLIEGIDWRNPRWSNRPEYIAGVSHLANNMLI